MKTLKFSQDQITYILLDEIDATLRYNDEKDLRVGDTITMVNKENGMGFAIATIVSVEEMKLGDIQMKHLQGTGHLEGEDIIPLYKERYGDGIGPESLFKVIHFKLN